MTDSERMQVDHRDHNGLNNQRFNLRIATRAQNQANRSAQANNMSGHKGVSWSKRRAKWQAQLEFNGIKLHLGSYTEKADAAAAYNLIAERLHGEFFAAAPAQERWYTKAELHDALIARNYEPKIADELAGWIADQLELAYKKGKERAQEQPVENSPDKCFKCGNPFDHKRHAKYGNDIDSAVKHEFEPSPQKGKP